MYNNFNRLVRLTFAPLLTNTVHRLSPGHLSLSEVVQLLACSHIPSHSQKDREQNDAALFDMLSPSHSEGTHGDSSALGGTCGDWLL